MIRKVAMLVGALLMAALVLAPAAGAAGEQARGNFVDGAGNVIGQVTLTQLADNSVRVAITLQDASVVKPGQHGIHFHAVGACAGPDFASAGAHFNPTGAQHGLQNPRGPHAGDLPNLVIDAATATQGGYAATLTTTLVTLTPGPASIFDADGTALVIHANPDDEMTDPSGNSGGRIACAVLTPAATPGLPNTGGGAAAAGRDLGPRVALLALTTLMLTGIGCGVARRRA